MNIGIDISRANTDKPTGVERYVSALLDELKKQIPDDVHVVLYTPVKKKMDIPKHWEVKILGWPPKRLWTQLRLSWEMLMHPPDVLFVPGHVMPIIHPKNTIVTIHDIAALTFPKAYSRFERWYSLWSTRYAANHAAAIISPSQSTKRDIIAYTGVHKDLVRTIYHGIYSQKVKSGHVATLKQMTKPFILFVGRIEYKKNIVQLIRAFNMIKNKHDIQLVLAGKPGVGYPEIKRKIQASKHSCDIIETGYLPDKDVDALYDQASVFVFLSRYEGFGFPVLEAMSFGCPVVCSDLPVLREVGGEAAIYVDQTDSGHIAKQIQSVLDQRQPIQILKKKGAKQVGKFTWQKTAVDTWRLIQEIYEHNRT